MAPVHTLGAISNPLITSVQLLALKQSDENNYPGTADDVRYTQAELTQSAALLLRLPQEVAAQAIVLLQRFNVLSVDVDASKHSPKDISAASLFLTAKLSSTPISPRSLLTVYHYLLSPSSPLILLNPSPPGISDPPDSTLHHLTEGLYETLRATLYTTESLILSTIGFNTHVALPHPLALTYLSVLGINTVTNKKFTTRVLGHLNTALLSPQFLYLTHQPNALATAAIYLAARETGVKLVEKNWWEVFDVEREDLGFLVVSFLGIGEFVEAVRERWRDRTVPIQ